MTSTRNRVATLFMVALVALAGIGAFAFGASAAVTTTGDLAGDGTDTITNFNASDTENHTVTYETSATSDTKDDFDELSLTIEHENNTYAEYTKADATVINGSSDSTTVLEVEYTIEHSDLEKLPGDATEITTANYTITELEAGTDTEVTDEFAVDYEFAGDHAVRTIHSSDDEIVTDFESSDDDGGFLSLSTFNPLSSSSDVATIEDDVGINGSETDVKVYSESDDVTGVFDDQLESADDGDRVAYLMNSKADGNIVYVFANEPGEKIGGDNVTEDDTYIVAHEGGEYEVNLGDEYEGENTASLSLTAGEKVDKGALQDDLEYTWRQAYGLSLDVWSLSDITDKIPVVGNMVVPAGGASLAGLLVVSRRQYGA